MGILPYIHFRGDCAEALTFYRDTFGGTDLQMMRYSEAPGAPGDAGDRVIHGQVMLDGAPLFASDYPPGMTGDPQQAVSICHTVADPDRGRALFEALRVGGETVAPFEATFFSPGFGMLKDRFGTHWMIMAGAPGT